MLLSLVRFILSFLGKGLQFFSGVPGKIALLLTALGAIVAECSSFVRSCRPYLEDIFGNLDSALSDVASYLSGNEIFSLLSYCCSLDILAAIVFDVALFVSLVLTFLFVAFLHLVLFYFGVKFGYSVYKYLLKVASNGLASA